MVEFVAGAGRMLAYVALAEAGLDCILIPPAATRTRDDRMINRIRNVPATKPLFRKKCREMHDGTSKFRENEQ